MTSSADSVSSSSKAARRAWTVGEVGLILLVFFLFAGSPVPDVNEAHYLAKAKHYWNPQWCEGDMFLQSADAHLVFNWTLGWLTLWLPLSAVAWVGRLLAWGLLAWGWRRLSFAVVPRRLMAVLTAAMMLMFMQHFHLAGEWIVGGVEAKGFAFVLVLLGMEAVVRGHWRAAWLLFGAASAFHVLVGGWSVVAAGFAWLVSGKDRARLWPMLPFLAGGLLLALPGLVPGLVLTWGVDEETVREANRIYVYERLSHHLAPHTFPLARFELPLWMFSDPPRDLYLPNEFVVRNVGLLIGWIALAWTTRPDERQRRLHRLVGGAVAIALVGVVIDLASIYQPDIGAALLRYYWFRLSDAMLPIGAALALGGVIVSMQRRRTVGHWALVAAILVVSWNLGSVVLDRLIDPRPGAIRQSRPTAQLSSIEDQRRVYDDWLGTCEWIAANTPPDALFLTPRTQQTFKWFAERGEVANWKDLPQDASSMVEWWRRVQKIYLISPESPDDKGLAAHTDQGLVELAHQYGAQYIVVDRTLSQRPILLPRVYPDRFETNASFEVYRVPPAGDEEPEPRTNEASDDR